MVGQVGSARPVGKAGSGIEGRGCFPCAGDTGIPGFGFRLGLALALAGQGMVFGLGYNNALIEGHAPSFGSIVYILIHGGLLISSLLVLFLLGGPLLTELRAAIAERRLSVEALFLLSALGALGGSLVSSLTGEGSVYYEVVAIVLCVYAIGKQLGSVQRGKLGEALSSLRNAYAFAFVRGADGEREEVPVADLDPEAVVLVRPGDPFPVDGTLLSGRGYVRETALTGEPTPVVRKPGDTVLAGTWSLDGNFEVQQHSGGQRSIDAILEILEKAPRVPSRFQAAADRLMSVFIPVVTLTSAGTFLAWWLFSSAPWWEALFNAMAVLLVACPCALGLAMPAGIWSSLYYLSQRGIIGRHGTLIDGLANCTAIAFDKTGTLTAFAPGLEVHLRPEGKLDREQLLTEVASLAAGAQHPVSEALARGHEDRHLVRDLEIFPGEGVRGRVHAARLVLGEADFLQRLGIEVPDTVPSLPAKAIHVARNEVYAGTLFLKEMLRDGVEATLQTLQEMGITCAILSGDPFPSTVSIAGIPVEGGLEPEAKASRLRELKAGGGHVLYVGDGINDLASMEASDAALAIDLGAALATEFADGVVVEGRIDALPVAIHKARLLKRRLEGNLRFALSYNLVGMALAAGGILHPVVAALLMVGSSVIVSTRALRTAAQMA